MNPTFFFSAIAVIALLLTVPGSAQEMQPAAPVAVTDTLPTIKMDSVATPVVKTDSLKITKKAKRKKKEIDATGYNPYQPNTTVIKPLPYNSNKDKPKQVEEGPGNAILRDIINNKKKN